MKKSKVCRGCEDRTSTCHATCERYKEECAELATQKEAIHREKAKETMLNEYEIKRCKRLKDWRRDDK